MCFQWQVMYIDAAVFLIFFCESDQMQQCNDKTNVQKTLLDSKEHVFVSVSLIRSALCLLCLIVINKITDHSNQLAAIRPMFI